MESNINNPCTIIIDRTLPFNPVTFFSDYGREFKISEQNIKTFTLTEVDFSKVIFETVLEKHERSVKGKEIPKRIEENVRIYLDAMVLKTLWENQFLIPKECKEEINGYPAFIVFGGTVFKDPFGERFYLYLYWWKKDNKWHCGTLSLDKDFDFNYLFAVLVNSNLGSALKDFKLCDN